ncbi:MAG: hypothetical protein H0U50_04455 [Pyrinomonadaceae bacterium]|nr:hypothetical protein [Pyrinomonadaceae bacterium]
MKLKIINWRLVGALAAVNFLFLGFLVNDSNAQTPRRSKTKKAHIQPTPAKTQGEPLIISRADEFPNENQVVVQPVVTNTETEKPVEKTDAAASDLINKLTDRVKNLEANQKKDSDEKQKRLLLNLDILTRAEQRSETLRKQLFDMIERESQIKTKLDQIENDIRPEMIERSVSFAGSLRPEELRDQRRKSLDIDKRNLKNLLAEIQNTKSNLELNLQKAELLVDKLRIKLEKEIDNALEDEPNQ